MTGDRSWEVRDEICILYTCALARVEDIQGCSQKDRCKSIKKPDEDISDVVVCNANVLHCVDDMFITDSNMVDSVAFRRIYHSVKGGLTVRKLSEAQ